MTVFFTTKIHRLGPETGAEWMLHEQRVRTRQMLLVGIFFDTAVSTKYHSAILLLGKNRHFLSCLFILIFASVGLLVRCQFSRARHWNQFDGGECRGTFPRAGFHTRREARAGTGKLSSSSGGLVYVRQRASVLPRSFSLFLTGPAPRLSKQVAIIKLNVHKFL